jgi:hypothetical protein
MSDMPDGAQMSDDGQWWWDEANQGWQPVGGGGGGGGYEETSSGGGEYGGYTEEDVDGGLGENFTEDPGQWGEGGGRGEQGGAAFEFQLQGLIVSKADGYGEEYDDDVLVANFGVVNVGTADGVPSVELLKDGESVGSWQPEGAWPPGYGEPGRIDGLGPYAAGEYQFVAKASPPGPAGGQSPAGVKIDAR